MAIHSSTLAWKIPWTEEPDRLQSMGSQRVGQRLYFHFQPLFQYKQEVMRCTFLTKVSSLAKVIR